MRDGAASTGPLLSLIDLKAQEIEMELTNLYGYETLQNFAGTKWRTRFLQGRTEIGDELRSERAANSDLIQGIAECILDRLARSGKYYTDISGARKRYVSDFSLRNSGATSFIVDGFHTGSPGT
jgi:hypothetical protein